LSRTPDVDVYANFVSSVTWKNEEKNFSKKSSHASENFLSLFARSSLSLRLFISSSLSLSLSRAKEDKDGSEDFEKRRRREKEEERV
jgi:hypothetical protein